MRRSLIRRMLPWMLLAVAGCAGVTEPNPLQNFQWVAIENPDDIHEGIDAVAFFGDIDLLGQLKTPTLCYNLTADFDRDGSDLRVHVTAKSTNAGNCNKNPGGFSYTALLRGLGSGSYTLHVTHTVVGGTETTYSKTLEIK